MADETTEEEKPPVGYVGEAAVYGPGGTFEKEQEAMWGGVGTSEDVAKAAAAAGPATLAAAQAQASGIQTAAAKQAGVIKGAHRNALVAARQAMAQKAQQATRRGRTMGGNIQATGSLAKEAGATFSQMASQQATEVGAVEQKAAEQVAGITAAATKEAVALDVIASKAWDEANTAVQDYWAGQSVLQKDSEIELQNRLTGWLTSVMNAASGAGAGTVAGFNSAWNQAGVYMADMDPSISHHIVAAEQLISEMLTQAPEAAGVPMDFIKGKYKDMFLAWGLQGTMHQLGKLTMMFDAGIPYTTNDGEEGLIEVGDQSWHYILNYMLAHGLTADELPPMAEGPSWGDAQGPIVFT